MKPTLFPELPEGAAPVASSDPAAPRLMRPNRNQVQLRPVDLESLLPDDHAARVVWAFVERLDLSPLYAKVRAVEGHAGRPAIDPAILLALWLFATLDGVGSAREIDRLCREHDAYRWICGGVGVNYHAISDFRVALAQHDLVGAVADGEGAAKLTDGSVLLWDGEREVGAGGVNLRTGAALAPGETAKAPAFLW